MPFEGHLNYEWFCLFIKDVCNKIMIFISLKSTILFRLRRRELLSINRWSFTIYHWQFCTKVAQTLIFLSVAGAEILYGKEGLFYFIKGLKGSLDMLLCNMKWLLLKLFPLLKINFLPLVLSVTKVNTVKRKNTDRPCPKYSCSYPK